MKRLAQGAIVLLAVLVLTTAAGCGKKEAPQAPEEEVSEETEELPELAQNNINLNNDKVPPPAEEEEAPPAKEPVKAGEAHGALVD